MNEVLSHCGGMNTQEAPRGCVDGLDVIAAVDDHDPDRQLQQKALGSVPNAWYRRVRERSRMTQWGAARSEPGLEDRALRSQPRRSHDALAVPAVDIVPVLL